MFRCNIQSSCGSRSNLSSWGVFTKTSRVWILLLKLGWWESSMKQKRTGKNINMLKDAKTTKMVIIFMWVCHSTPQQSLHNTMTLHRGNFTTGLIILESYVEPLLLWYTDFSECCGANFRFTCQTLTCLTGLGDIMVEWITCCFRYDFLEFSSIDPWIFYYSYN